jgi:hypothetical protein
VLVGLVLLVSQYFIKLAAAPIATKEGAAKSAQPVTPAAVEKPRKSFLAHTGRERRRL